MYLCAKNRVRVKTDLLVLKHFRGHSSLVINVFTISRFLHTFYVLKAHQLCLKKVVPNTNYEPEKVALY